jgi:hypothetical protein
MWRFTAFAAHAGKRDASAIEVYFLSLSRCWAVATPQLRRDSHPTAYFRATMRITNLYLAPTESRAFPLLEQSIGDPNSWAMAEAVRSRTPLDECCTASRHACYHALNITLRAARSEACK